MADAITYIVILTIPSIYVLSISILAPKTAKADLTAHRHQKPRSGHSISHLPFLLGSSYTVPILPLLVVHEHSTKPIHLSE